MPRRQLPWNCEPRYASSQELRASGWSKSQIARAVEVGSLVRLRRGKFVPAGTQPDLVAAARLGGRLDCVSLLRNLGVFVLDSGPLHIQIDPVASRVPERTPGVVAHWKPTTEARESLTTEFIEALVQAVRCQDPRSAIATLDSAMHLGLLDDRDLAEVFARLPRRHRVLRALVDRRSESGPESLVRLILRSLGCAFEVQVRIRGVGRVDFVVDGWLIIECDSEEFHSGWAAQKRDRRRDAAAAALGFTTVRLLAEDIMWSRDHVTRQLRQILDHGRRTCVPNS